MADTSLEPQEDKTVTVHPERLKAYAARLLEKAGMTPEAAALVADTLVAANLRGVDSHGIVRLPAYINKMQKGGTNPRPHLRVVRDGIATALVDGDHGMGQEVAAFAMRLAIEKARHAGIAMVGVFNSEHFGAAAYYAMMAARENMIGIALSNTTPVMAPWGGRTAAIGNNPIAIAVPKKDGKSLVLDISMSKVAGGKVRLAAKKGERIPEGWIVDKYGAPTTDPNDIVEGALLPGDHKAYGLAVMIEVLSAALTGAGMLSAVPIWIYNPDKPCNIGHSLIAINIEHFLPLPEFLDRVASMEQELRSSPPGIGTSEILLPGDIEERTAAARASGLQLPLTIYNDLLRLGLELDVDQRLLTGE